MTTYSNAFFGIPENDHRFNLDAAVDAYEWVMAHPGEARFVLSKCLYDNVPKDMEYHQPIIQKAADAFISKQLADVKRGVARSIISKSERGEDTTAIGSAVMVIDAISKAYAGELSGENTPEQRAERAERQQRDRYGRFVVMARKIKPNELKQPIRPQVAADSFGIPNARMNDDTRRKWQNDYRQVQQVLTQALESAGGEEAAENMIVRAKYTDGSDFEMTFPDAQEAIDDVNTANTGLVRSADYNRGTRVSEIEVLNNRPAGSGARFDALSAMTNPRFAAGVAGAYHGSQEFTEDWTTSGSSDYRTNDQFWRRMGAASQLAATVGAPYLPPAATMALQAGKWVGDLAPEAEKVIGPAARKSAYRYRGTEKKPDERYQAVINQARTDAINSNDPQPGRKAHATLIRGDINPKTKEDIPSPLIKLFQDKLTNASRYHLNRQAGVIPPSQGIVIDRKGRVVTEAVGYGEDWYLPFNLKNLNRLDGGEYIRTRAYGGPTTEDIYAGLVSGARGLTVVSHSGVFHIEFDDTFRGTRRYNDKAGRMQDRYGQLLDAVKSKKVRLGEIRPDRLEELKELAGNTDEGGFDPIRNRSDYNERLETLKAEERESPDLSKAERDAVAVSLLNEWSNEKGAASWNDFADAAGVKGNFTPLSFKDDYNAAIKYAGLDKEYEKALEEKFAVVKEELSPLDLNGKGYYQAMEALRDQFPYYVSDVYYSGAVKREPVQARDLGYVKPRFIRPEGALSGYFDETITGHGKITADRTNYQNYPVMRDRSFNPKEIKASDEEEIVPGRAVRGRGTVNADAKALDDLVDQIRALREQRVFNSSTTLTDTDGNPIGDRPLTDEYRQQFAEDWGWDFLTDDMDEIERKVYASGVRGAEYRRLRQKVDEAFDGDEKVFPITRNDVRSTSEEEATGAPPKGAMNIIFTLMDDKQYAWPDLKEGQSRSYYDSKIAGWLSKTDALDGVDLSSDAQVTDAVGTRADQLRRALRAVHSGASNLTEEAIEDEAKALAKIKQAAIMRAEAAELPPTRRGPVPLRPEPEAVPFGEASEEEAYEEPEAEEEHVVDPVEAERKQRIATKQAEIKSMIGMRTVGDEIDKIVATAEDREWRLANGFPVDENARNHLIFTGNPGTGKTTVARKLAPIYKDLGLIKSSKLEELKEGDLVGEFVNQENTHVNDVLNERKGHMIFIDEAYTLLQSDGGKKALNVIMQWADDNKEDSIVVLAGYPKEMAEVKRFNPGMASRFPNTVHFPDYDAKDLREIAANKFAHQHLTLEPKAQVSLNIALGKLTKMPDYSNVRSAENLLTDIRHAHNMRVAGIRNASSEERLTITRDDVKNGLLRAQMGNLEQNAVKARRRVAAGVV